MFILGFHGGSGKSDLNNLHVYTDAGEPAAPDKLLAHTDGAPRLQELRGFAFRGKDLYVVNAYKDYSQLLRYQAGAGSRGGQYVFSEVLASAKTVNGILHPFDVAFDSTGNIYLSSQDTNVVTGLDPQGNPLPIAPFLLNAFPGRQFLAGTQVASSVGGLPSSPTPVPPCVPKPQGLDVKCSGGKPGKVEHSVRGVVCVGPSLLVADEPADAVKVYSTATGQLQGQICGNDLTAPVHLLVQEDTLYISGGNDTIYTCPLPGGKAPTGIVTPTPWHR